jgi:hypothetical protein
MTLSKVQLRIVIGVLLAIVAGSVIGLTRLDNSESAATDAIIESFIPAKDDKVLQQNNVGVDMLTGWDASLSINGVNIPDDELTKTLELGQVLFAPGPGRVIEALPPGQNYATVTYWQTRTGPDQSFTQTWFFTVV